MSFIGGRDAERPAPDRLSDRHRGLRASNERRQRGSATHRALLPHGHARLRHPGARLPGVHEVARSRGAGRGDERRRARAGHRVRARSRDRRVQHRRDDPLARLQRHVARGRVGPSVRQPRRDSGRRRLSLPETSRRRAARADDGRRADGHDQGARDPGRAGAESQLQSRRLGSRAARARREHRGRDANARRHSRPDRERRVERVARRRCATHVPARAEHGLAQELGRGRRDEPRRPARVVRARGRDGLSVGVDREGVGFPGRAVQR